MDAKVNVHCNGKPNPNEEQLYELLCETALRLERKLLEKEARMAALKAESKVICYKNGQGEQNN